MKLERQQYEITIHTRWFSVTFSRTRQKRLQLQQAGYWRTKDGRIVHVSEMDDNHLRNTIHFLERKALEEAECRFPSPRMYPAPRSEMAQELYWRGMAEYDLISVAGKYGIQQRFLEGQPIYKLMIAELEKRSRVDPAQNPLHREDINKLIRFFGGD